MWGGPDGADSTGVQECLPRDTVCPLDVSLDYCHPDRWPSTGSTGHFQRRRAEYRSFWTAATTCSGRSDGGTAKTISGNAGAAAQAVRIASTAGSGAV